MLCELSNMREFQKVFCSCLHRSSAWCTLICCGSLKLSYLNHNLVLSRSLPAESLTTAWMTHWHAAVTVLLISADCFTPHSALLPLFSCTSHTFTKCCAFSTTCSLRPLSLSLCNLSFFISICLIFSFFFSLCYTPIPFCSIFYSPLHPYTHSFHSAGSLLASSNL